MIILECERCKVFKKGVDVVDGRRVCLACRRRLQNLRNLLPTASEQYRKYLEKQLAF